MSEVAARGGVTVRALHHHDHFGLLRPTRDDAGRRRYSAADVSRLIRIAVLRRLGLALPDIEGAPAIVGGPCDRNAWRRHTIGVQFVPVTDRQWRSATSDTGTESTT